VGAIIVRGGGGGQGVREGVGWSSGCGVVIRV
jgi:hypothetical protein